MNLLKLLQELVISVSFSYFVTILLSSSSVDELTQRRAMLSVTEN